jgi:prepilin-type processing-associated H-X9-DG protein
LTGDKDISYFAGTNSSPLIPLSIVAGDCNVTGSLGGLDPSWNLAFGSSIDATWDLTFHNGQGNLALADGSVHPVTSGILREFIYAALGGGATNVVFSMPRGVL